MELKKKRGMIKKALIRLNTHETNKKENLKNIRKFPHTTCGTVACEKKERKKILK